MSSSRITPPNYYQTHSSTYQIPSIIYDQPSNRKIKVINIGTGLNSINTAYHIRKSCRNVELTLYDRYDSLGGTWLVNRYPGVACDVPSHVYQFSWAPNPDWPRYYSFAHEIAEYLEKVCEVFDLKRHMKFRVDVHHAEWLDRQGQWLVKCRETLIDGSTREFDDFADVLLNNAGIQNDWKWPDIEGLDKFKGKLLHTARWDPQYQAAQWQGQTVAVIGGGASSVQTVPFMQPHVKHMDVYVRTGVWFVGLGSEAGGNTPYTEEDFKRFREAPSLAKHGKQIEHFLNGLFPAFYKGSDAQAKFQEMFRQRTANLLKDEKLLKGFSPAFQLGCRRVTPGDPYIQAVQQDNVDVLFKSVTRLTETGVVDSDGVERPVDAVICATGFDVSYKPRFPIIGLNGVDLRDKWSTNPDSYMGISVAGFPNYFFSSGPYWPVANGSLIGASNASARYACAVIQKLQRQPNIRFLAPRQDVMDAFAAHCQEWYRGMVWSDACPSWYKDEQTGRVRSVWPGITLHHARVMSLPRWEDYEYGYKLNASGTTDNIFSFLGKGLVPEMFDETLDDSPHFLPSNIDPTWARAKGITIEPDREAVANTNMNDEVKTHMNGTAHGNAHNGEVKIHMNGTANGDVNNGEVKTYLNGTAHGDAHNGLLLDQSKLTEKVRLEREI